jgi:phage baseplate assembly protein W
MRQVRKYSDLDAVFLPNPVTGDIAIREDAAAVKFAIKNLILTQNFERPFDSSIGSPIRRFMFENIDTRTLIVLKELIAQTIENHEPRVDLISTDIKPDGDHSVVINIMFRIKNTDKPLSLSIALDRTR